MSRVIAVTGASGFIGRYLCAALEQTGDRVLRLGRGAPSGPDDRQTDYSRDSLVAALRDAGYMVTTVELA